MARHRRHYRKVKQHHQPGITSTPSLDVAPIASPTGVTESNSSTLAVGQMHVRQDLWTTAITTFVLAGLLVVLYVVNRQTGWTLNFGTFLYGLLHIR